MRAVLVVAALAFGAACGRPEPVLHDAFPALGTIVEVTVRGEHGEHALRAVREAVDHAHHDWYGWGDGELGRYNAAVGDGDDPAPLSPALERLLERAHALGEASGGLFDPTVGALVEAWGFHDAASAGGPPPEDAIAAWLTGGLPARTDLGAVAKGAALELAASRLARIGVRDALVNAGGDIVALGDAGGRPWRIGIRDPRGVGVIAGIELGGGETVFTSGDYERRYEHGGVEYHHILDPRTGRPARASASVTVVHRDPVLADAAATALFVAGDAWPATAAAMDVTLVLRVRADGSLEATPELAERLRLEVAADRLERIRATDAR